MGIEQYAPNGNRSPRYLEGGRDLPKHKQGNHSRHRWFAQLGRRNKGGVRYC